MLRLFSMLDGEAKRVIAAIGSDCIFYATALKTLKKDFGDPLLLAYLKIKVVFDRPHVKTNDRIGLTPTLKILQLLVMFNWLRAPLLSRENIAKALIYLLRNILNDLYNATKKKNFVDGSANLIVLERWLDSRFQNYFNLLANIATSHEK